MLFYLLLKPAKGNKADSFWNISGGCIDEDATLDVCIYAVVA